MSTKTLQVVINTSGVMRFVYDDDLASLCDAGMSVIQRASHVEPDVDGTWFVDMSPVNGPVLRGFKLRQEALNAEVRALRTMGF